MSAKVNQAGEPTFLSSDRLASLSDTMFGVAMTLVVTTLLPTIQAHKGPALDLLLDMNVELAAVGFSFAISGIYWVSQQQRLAMVAVVTPRQTLLHLLFLFLFLIVLVPISASLPGVIGTNVALTAVVIYGTHYTLLALVNLMLWIDVHRSVAVHPQIVRSSLVLAVFVVGLTSGLLQPYLAQYIWPWVFVVPLINRNLTRRIYGI